MSPRIAATWQLPAASANGTAKLSRETTEVTCKAPAVDVSAALHVVPPSFEAIKKAVTQAEITALAQPVHLPPFHFPVLNSTGTSSLCGRVRQHWRQLHLELIWPSALVKKQHLQAQIEAC